MPDNNFLYDDIPLGHRSVIEALTMHHEPTAIHSLNVAKVTKEFLEYLGASESDIKKSYLAALTHDAGKLMVDIDILDKKGILSPTEQRILSEHTINGANYLKGNASLKGITDFDIAVAKLHHSNSATLPYLIRAIEICDVYVALTEKRSYRLPVASREALKIMLNSDRQRYLDRCLLFRFADFINQKELRTN